MSNLPKTRCPFELHESKDLPTNTKLDHNIESPAPKSSILSITPNHADASTVDTKNRDMKSTDDKGCYSSIDHDTLKICARPVNNPSYICDGSHSPQFLDNKTNAACPAISIGITFTSPPARDTLAVTFSTGKATSIQQGPGAIYQPELKSHTSELLQRAINTQRETTAAQDAHLNTIRKAMAVLEK